MASSSPVREVNDLGLTAARASLASSPTPSTRRQERKVLGSLHPNIPVKIKNQPSPRPSSSIPVAANGQGSLTSHDRQGEVGEVCGVSCELSDDGNGCQSNPGQNGDGSHPTQNESEQNFGPTSIQGNGNTAGVVTEQPEKAGQAFVMNPFITYRMLLEDYRQYYQPPDEHGDIPRCEKALAIHESNIKSFMKQPAETCSVIPRQPPTPEFRDLGLGKLELVQNQEDCSFCQFQCYYGTSKAEVLSPTSATWHRCKDCQEPSIFSDELDFILESHSFTEPEGCYGDDEDFPFEQVRDWSTYVESELPSGSSVPGEQSGYDGFQQVFSDDGVVPGEQSKCAGFQQVSSDNGVNENREMITCAQPVQPLLSERFVFQIQLKGGNLVTYYAKPSTPVLQIKNLLQVSHGLNVDDWHLLFHGVPLNDARRLGEYCVDSGAIIVPIRKTFSREGVDITQFMPALFCDGCPWTQVDVKKAKICSPCRNFKLQIIKHGRHITWTSPLKSGQSNFCMICINLATSACTGCPLVLCSDCSTRLGNMCKGDLNLLIYFYKAFHIRNDAFLLRSDGGGFDKS